MKVKISRKVIEEHLRKAYMTGDSLPDFIEMEGEAVEEKGDYCSYCDSRSGHLKSCPSSLPEPLEKIGLKYNVIVDYLNETREAFNKLLTFLKK